MTAQTNNPKTVTLSQIKLLNSTIADAAGWRGAQHPDYFEEFDEYIDNARKALRQIKKDRALLRKLLSQELPKP